MTSATIRPPGSWGGQHGRPQLHPGSPFWSLAIIAVDVVALYGLCVYGSPENLGAV